MSLKTIYSKLQSRFGMEWFFFLNVQMNFWLKWVFQRDHGVTPPIPEGCPPLYEKIMRACWKYNPEERPVRQASNNTIWKKTLTICFVSWFIVKTFEQIIELLEGVRDEIDIVKSEKTVHQTEKTSQPKENQRTQSDKSDDWNFSSYCETNVAILYQ
jgi:hypothetical protein